MMILILETSPVFKKLKISLCHHGTARGDPHNVQRNDMCT